LESFEQSIIYTKLSMINGKEGCSRQLERNDTIQLTAYRLLMENFTIRIIFFNLKNVNHF